MKTVVIPVVVGALGTAKKGMVLNIEKVSERATMTESQKTIMMGMVSEQNDCRPE